MTALPILPDLPKQHACSSLPRFKYCASSALPPTVRINIPSDESSLGHAVHHILACVVLGAEYELADVAKQHGCDEVELAKLVSYGIKAWSEIAQYFRSPLVEQRVEGPKSRGLADILDIDDIYTAGDWKSGYVRRDHQEQTAGYLDAAREVYGPSPSGRYRSFVIWLRYGEIEVVEWSDADLDRWRAAVTKQETRIGKDYAPGEHCGHCHRRLECRAFELYLLQAASVVADVTQRDRITPEELAAEYTKTRMVGKALEAYDKALKIVLGSLPNPLPIGDGRVIGLAEGSKSEIDARKALPLLKESGFTAADLNRVTSMSKGAIEEIVGERAAKGMKGKDKAAIVQRLREAGAITTTTYLKLEARKAEENPNE